MRGRFTMDSITGAIVAALGKLTEPAVRMRRRLSKH